MTTKSRARARDETEMIGTAKIGRGGIGLGTTGIEIATGKEEATGIGGEMITRTVNDPSVEEIGVGAGIETERRNERGVRGETGNAKSESS